MYTLLRETLVDSSNLRHSIITLYPILFLSIESRCLSSSHFNNTFFIVIWNQGIMCNKKHILRLGLCHEHSIKRVIMRWRIIYATIIGQKTISKYVYPITNSYLYPKHSGNFIIILIEVIGCLQFTFCYSDNSGLRL